MFAGYVRVSRVGDRAETLISPELQSERIRSYAKTKGVEVEVLDAELDVSGGSLERPILDTALAGIESGLYEGLIVAQQDRLSRMGILDTHRLLSRIELAGGRFLSAAENLDGSTPQGKFGRNVLFNVAEMELDRYKVQFAVAKERAVRNGVWPLPHLPVGYQRDENRRLAPDPNVRVREAFEARAAGASWDEVAEILGKPLSTARRVLSNRVYLGEINYGSLTNRKAHPPLVSRSLWEAVQVARLPGSRARNPALLSGLVRCAGCQGRMTAFRRSYGCQGRVKVGGRCLERAWISRPFLEDLVQRAVLAHLGSLSISAVERSHALKEAEDTLSTADTELAAYQEATRVSTLGADNFLAGMRSRIEAVDLARRKLANMRVAVPIPFDISWEDLSVSERRHVLSRSLAVVFVKQGWRVRIVAGHWEPPAHGALVIPLNWKRHLKGEIRVPAP